MLSYTVSMQNISRFKVITNEVSIQCSVTILLWSDTPYVLLDKNIYTKTSLYLFVQSTIDCWYLKLIVLLPRLYTYINMRHTILMYRQTSTIINFIATLLTCTLIMYDDVIIYFLPWQHVPSLRFPCMHTQHCRDQALHSLD